MFRPRVYVGACVAVAAVFPLAACSGASGAKADEIVFQSIATRGTPEGDALKRVMTAYTKETGTKVKWLDSGDAWQDIYETSVAGGNEADLVFGNLVAKSFDWVKNGAVVPMDPYLKEWDLTDTIMPGAVTAWRDADGKLVGLPYGGFVWPVLYNTDLLAEAGVDEIPTTTDGLIAAATKLRAKGITPMAIGGNDWTGQKLFLQIAQAYAKPADAEKVFKEGGFCTNADILKGVELFTELRDGGVFIDDAEGYVSDSMTTAYSTGAAAIMSAGSWAFGDIPAEVAKVTTLSGFPNPAGGTYEKNTAYRGYTTNGLMLSKNGEEKIDQIKPFVELLYSTSTLEDFVSNANIVVDSTKAANAEVKNPLLQQAVSDLDARVNYAVMPDASVPAAVAEPLIRATSMAYSPGNDAKAICAGVDAVYASIG